MLRFRRCLTWGSRWLLFFFIVPTLTGAESVTLSRLVDHDAALSSHGLTFTNFRFSSVAIIPTFPVSDIGVELVADANTVGLRFGSFTAPADSLHQARIAYTVLSQDPISELRLQTPAFTTGPSATPRSFEDAGFIVFASIEGPGENETFADGVGFRNNPLSRPVPLGGLTNFEVQNSIQVFGGSTFPGDSGDPFVTLPYLDNLFTVSASVADGSLVIPEPSTWQLMVTGILLLTVSWRASRVSRGTPRVRIIGR